jgi:Helix-turn-helix domain
MQDPKTNNGNPDRRAPSLVDCFREVVMSSYGPPEFATRLVLVAISISLFDDTGDGAFPGQALIAERTKLSERHVRRHIDEAVRLGWIETQKVRRRHGRSWYRLAYRIPDAIRGRIIENHAKLKAKRDDRSIEVPERQSGSYGQPDQRSGAHEHQPDSESGSQQSATESDCHPKEADPASHPTPKEADSNDGDDRTHGPMSALQERFRDRAAFAAAAVADLTETQKAKVVSLLKLYPPERVVEFCRADNVPSEAIWRQADAMNNRTWSPVVFHVEQNDDEDSKHASSAATQRRRAGSNGHRGSLSESVDSQSIGALCRPEDRDRDLVRNVVAGAGRNCW